MIRRARRTPVALVILAATLGSGVAVAHSACPGPAGETARVVAVDERVELALDDGRRLRIWGIDVPDEGGRARDEARERLRRWLAAATVTVQGLAGTADRWGRIEAHVHASRPNGPPLSLAEALLDAGLARFRPEDADPACQQRLRSLEARAFLQGLGVWTEPRLRPLPATERSAFVGRAGEQVIVQGRVDSVSTTAFATYLNFGPIRTVDFAVTVRTRLRPRVEALHGALEALQGRRLEVRGLLDTRFGPQIDLDLPSALHPLDGGVSPSPYSGRETRR